jgi:hypothetical protein
MFGDSFISLSTWLSGAGLELKNNPNRPYREAKLLSYGLE